MCVNRSVCQIALIITLAIPLIWGGFRFTGLDCRAVDPTFCAFVNCTIKPIKRGVKEINGAVRLLKVPVDNITIRAKIFRRGYSKHALYSFDIDGCKFWTTKRRNPVAFAMYSLLKFETFTNINHSCPYDHDLILNHFIIDDSFVFYLPITTGEYVLTSHWIAYNVLRATVDFKFAINRE